MTAVRTLATVLGIGGLSVAFLVAGAHTAEPSSSAEATLEVQLEDAAPSALVEAAPRCSCAREPDPDKRAAGYFEFAELVAEARVVAIDTLGGPPPTDPPGSLEEIRLDHPVLATLEVERWWKGGEDETLVLRMTDAWVPMSCDMILREGERYLVFAREVEEEDWARAGYCTGTSTLEHAEEEGLRDRVRRLAGDGATGGS